MKCCGEQMERYAREDRAGVFWICYECMTILCPDDPVQVTEIGR